MSTKNILIWVIVGIVILGGIYLFDTKLGIFGNSAGIQGLDSEVPEENGIKTFSSPEYKISFDYTSKYIFLDRDLGSPEAPQKAIVMVEDTQRNRDILEGKVAEVGDGPTAITVDIFKNSTALTVDAWVDANTNWTSEGNMKEPVTVQGKTGVTYFWDGLYAGKSSVITDGLYTYVFSVTWITEEDQMVKDFEDLLGSVKFVN